MGQGAQLFTEAADLLGVINPSSSSGIQDSGNVLLENYHKAVVIIHVGAIATNGTVDADLEQASNTAAGTRKAITGKSITQLTDADDNKVVVIELDSSELDVDNGFEYINLELTCATAASIIGAQIWGLSPRFAAEANAAIEEVVN